ncbi:MAG: RluA family pseudouridine synthase [Chitinivibrionales bacterium]|nr:RluA family pseudouridine synthase [Chitinivibrionales bacterium]
MNTYIIDENSSGSRLDVFVAGVMEGMTRSQVQKAIKSGGVLVNGTVAGKNVRLKRGDDVTIDEQEMTALTSTTLVPQDIPLDIVYEDNYLIAVNKPAGMVVHPGSGVRDSTLANALAYHIPSLSDGFAHDRPGIVHRLDKETSGILLVAKTNQAHAALASLFSERKISKRYIGICIGARPQEQGTIEAPIGRSRSDPIRHVIKKNGKPAKTSYRLLTFESGISVVEFSPHTGRTHQIRIHASYTGFPVVADPLYGGDREQVKKIAPLYRPFAYKIFKCFTRHALHAFKISFIHPFTQKETELSAPFPGDMNAAIALFEKNGKRPETSTP